MGALLGSMKQTLHGIYEKKVRVTGEKIISELFACDHERVRYKTAHTKLEVNIKSSLRINR
jgi:hypothetical protein